MKRLFACIGLTLLSALTIVFYFGIFGSAFLLVMAVGIMGAGLFLKKFADNRAMLVTVAVVLVLGCAYSNLYTGLYFNPQSEAYDGKTVTIEAEVESPPYHNYSYCYDLSTTEIDGKQKNIKLLLKTPNELDIDYQDTIKCTVNLKKCDNDYYKSKGYLYTAKSEKYYLEYEVEKAETKGFLYYINQVKESLLHSISTVIPGEEGQLSRAVALGDKYVMSRNLRRSFSNSGLSYLIVVSGLHMSILAGFVLMLFRKAPATTPFNIIKSTILIGLILSFMLITGLSPSVVRSGIMIGFTFLGGLFRRKSDSLNNLG
ncbi:MAG: ComEC/Rec2 family competence protein, partial [Ruminococcus sp.]